MTRYAKSLNVHDTRVHSISIRINSNINQWLEVQRQVENLSLSSYVYEILQFFFESRTHTVINENKTVLPKLNEIRSAFTKYMLLYDVKGQLFEEKIKVYLTDEQLNLINIEKQMYGEKLSKVLRYYLHLFYLADHFYRNNHDVPYDLCNGLRLGHLKMNYFINDLSMPNSTKSEMFIGNT